MKRLTRNGVIAVAAASGAMAVTMPAHADSAADGAAVGSPGVISGNTVQIPVHVPANVCGNTVNVAGLLNPAAGNTCANEGGTGAGRGGATRSGAAGSSGQTASSDKAASSGGASAQGGGTDSPGLLSGNTVQLPVHVPVNVSGNTVNVVGVGNPAVGNESVNGHPAKPTPRPPAEPPTTAPPRAHHSVAPEPRAAAQTAEVALAHTGADLTVPALAASGALLLSGAALYRRYRPGAGR
ncbi:chaplin [Streptomyces sp. NPDC001508]|uniref:chaplin n=1 Tax=Streptomyces sp. NPDC001508 TaxID=3154656 RepID=UPI0033300448